MLVNITDNKFDHKDISIDDIKYLCRMLGWVSKYFDSVSKH